MLAPGPRPCCPVRLPGPAVTHLTSWHFADPSGSVFILSQGYDPPFGGKIPVSSWSQPWPVTAELAELPRWQLHLVGLAGRPQPRCLPTNPSHVSPALGKHVLTFRVGAGRGWSARRAGGLSRPTLAGGGVPVTPPGEPGGQDHTLGFIFTGGVGGVVYLSFLLSCSSPISFWRAATCPCGEAEGMFPLTGAGGPDVSCHRLGQPGEHPDVASLTTCFLWGLGDGGPKTGGGVRLRTDWPLSSHSKSPCSRLLFSPLALPFAPAPSASLGSDSVSSQSPSNNSPTLIRINFCCSH